MLRKKLTSRQIRIRYGDVCQRTVDRWVKGGILPPPELINGRRYFAPPLRQSKSPSRAAMVWTRSRPPLRRRAANEPQQSQLVATEI